MHVAVLPTCVSVHKTMRFPVTGIIDSCEHSWVLGTEPGPSEREAVLLTTELSLEPQDRHFYMCQLK